MEKRYSSKKSQKRQAKRSQRSAFARKRQRNGASWVVGILAALVVAAYFGGVAFFSFNIMPNTTVNGEDLSLRAGSEVAEEVHARGAEYTAHVTGDGIDLGFESADIELSYDGDAFVEAILSQLQKWLWPYEVFQPHELELQKPVEFRAKKLRKLTNAAVETVNTTAQGPTNATIAFDTETGKFAIAEEALGTALDKKLVYEKVSEGVSDLLADIELGDAQLEQPTVFQDDERLATARELANSYVKSSIDLTVEDKRVYVVKPKLISNWIVVNSDVEAELSLAAVTSWAQGPLSKKFDTVASSRTYERADGKTVTVKGGTYGWIIDGASLASALTGQLGSSNTDPIEIPMKARGEVWNPGGADWGRYIDVDISEQHVRLYSARGKVLWESDCVTGNVSEGHDTPQGVYALLLKDKNRTLIGADEDKDGKPDYKSKVKFWMPFLGEDVGLHDASWRKYFGGDIYKTDGSHGCVNLPKKKASALYDIIEVGDVVSVHE